MSSEYRTRTSGLLGGMTAGVHFLEFGHGDPGVGHRGLQLLVSEHLSDEAHVRSRVEHQRRRGVTKEVTTPLLTWCSGPHVGAHQSRDDVRGNRRTADAQKESGVQSILVKPWSHLVEVTHHPVT